MATREYTVQRIAPMSAFRTAFSLSIIGLAAWIICAVVLYLGMAAFGVWDQVNQVIGGVGGDQTLSFGGTHWRYFCHLFLRARPADCGAV